MQVQSGYAEVNGTKLYYETAGRGHALVLIHGGLMDRRMWEEQFTLFAKDYQVIRYNIRGYEKSQKPNPSESFSHVEDLYCLLEHLNVEKAFILGLSLGGQIAIDFTLEHPDMVNALIPVASALNGFPYADKENYAEKFAGIHKTAKRGDLDGAIDLVLDLSFFVPVEEKPTFRPRMRAMVIDNYEAWSAPQDRLIWSDPPAFTRLREITVPVLVVVGDQDVSDILNVADTLAHNISNAKKTVIRNAGHHVNMEQPEAFNEAVLQCLEEL